MAKAPQPLVRKKLRAQSYDYSSTGTYWVTICVYHMECRFGAVVDGIMRLNEAGRMVDDHWRSLPGRFAGLKLDAFIVMPNHLHGIIFLGAVDEGSPVSLSAVVGAFKSLTTVEYSHGVRTENFPPYDRSLWQRSFQDRIVQSDRRLDDLRGYVEGNPGRWQEKQDSRLR
ncbi:MAG: transposase [Chloroflexia bacterium]|nr:transposase [Chloroflexia bacterium]